MKRYVARVPRLPRGSPAGAAAALVEWRSQRFAGLLSRSGIAGNPRKMAESSVRRTVLAAAAAGPPGLALGLSVHPMLFFVMLVPLAVFVLPEVRLRDAASRRKEGVERTLPYFSILVNVMGGAGMSLYSMFEEIASSDVLGPMKREALRVRRDSSVFGMDSNQAFERLAASHPSRKLASFLYGYTSKVRSGGDMSAYLTGQSASFVKELEEAWGRYSDRAGIVGSLMITVFGVVPLLLLVISIFSPAASVVGLLGFTGVAVPFFAAVLVLMAGRMQPAQDTNVHGKPLRSLLLSLVGVPLGYALWSVWAGAAMALSTFFISYGLSVRRELASATAVESALPEFLKDVLEYKRQDYSLSKALVHISTSNRYNAEFDRLLAAMSVQLRAGVPVEGLRVSTSCGLAALVFFLLGQMSRTGGGTVDTVFQMLQHTSSVVDAKRKARVEMRPYLVLSFASPMMLAFGVTFVRGILSSFGASFKLGLSGASVPTLQIGTIPPALGQVSDLLVVASAAALGIIGAKLTEFTVKSTLKASLNLIVAVAVMVGLSAFGAGGIFHHSG